MTRIEQIWAEERRAAILQPAGLGELQLTRTDPVSRFDFYGGIDDAGHALIAVGVRRRPPAVVMHSSVLDHFRLERADGSWLMVLRLREEGLEPVFGRLCQDLADAANSVGTEPELIALLIARLKLWETLFLGSEDGLLQPHEIRGLVAELLVLESILDVGARDPLIAIEGWLGPCGSDRDYVFPDTSLEVKAMASGRDRVTISSLEQLDTKDPLVLVVVELQKAGKTAAGAISLNALVGRIEGRVATDPTVLARFKERLLEARYVDNLRYDKSWFVSQQIRMFDVRAGFPRLTPAGVPAGVVAATYDVALKEITVFEIGGRPR